MKKAQNLAPNTIKDIWRSLEKYIFPDIGDRPVTELTARIFVNVLESIRARGNLETLKRVLQRVNEVMDYTATSGLIEVNTAANVRKAFPVPTKKPIRYQSRRVTAFLLSMRIILLTMNRSFTMTGHNETKRLVLSLKRKSTKLTEIEKTPQQPSQAAGTRKKPDDDHSVRAITHRGSIWLAMLG